jgi:hypothetical protein
MNHMKIIRLSLLAALVLVLPASLLSSTESQLQTDLSGVLTIDFFVDILSQSNLQLTAAGPALVRGPTPSLVNTLHMSFPINGGAINQQTLRGELTHAGGMVIASKGKSVTLSSPLLTFGSDFGSADDQTSTLSVLVSVGDQPVRRITLFQVTEVTNRLGSFPPNLSASFVFGFAGATLNAPPTFLIFAMTREAAELLNNNLPGAQFQANQTRATGDLAVVIRY